LSHRSLHHTISGADLARAPALPRSRTQRSRRGGGRGALAVSGAVVVIALTSTPGCAQRGVSLRRRRRGDVQGKRMRMRMRSSAKGREEKRKDEDWCLIWWIVLQQLCEREGWSVRLRVSLFGICAFLMIWVIMRKQTAGKMTNVGSEGQDMESVWYLL
jgi:hypothetical protein